MCWLRDFLHICVQNRSKPLQFALPTFCLLTNASRLHTWDMLHTIFVNFLSRSELFRGVISGGLESPRKTLCLLLKPPQSCSECVVGFRKTTGIFGHCQWWFVETHAGEPRTLHKIGEVRQRHAVQIFCIINVTLQARIQVTCTSCIKMLQIWQSKTNHVQHSFDTFLEFVHNGNLKGRFHATQAQELIWDLSEITSGKPSGAPSVHGARCMNWGCLAIGWEFASNKNFKSLSPLHAYIKDFDKGLHSHSVTWGRCTSSISVQVLSVSETCRK